MTNSLDPRAGSDSATQLISEIRLTMLHAWNQRLLERFLELPGESTAQVRLGFCSGADGASEWLVRARLLDRAVSARTQLGQRFVGFTRHDGSRPTPWVDSIPPSSAVVELFTRFGAFRMHALGLPSRS